MKLVKISKHYDIPIIDDSAEALGSSYKNQKCGTFGDLPVISFNGNKIIITSGGGCLILKNKEFKKKADFLSTQGKDEAPNYEHEHRLKLSHEQYMCRNWQRTNGNFTKTNRSEASQ